ncbi:MAG: hypothetical protein ACLFUH_09290 [Bacteroidales bacterium]
MKVNQKAITVENDYKNNKSPNESYTDAMYNYYAYLRTEDNLEDHYIIAFDIYRDEFQRELFEGLVIGGADPYDVNEVFGIPESAQEVYRELFFDISAFKTKLDLISYIENYPDKWGKEVKMRAYSFGPEFLYYTYAQIIPKTKAQHELVERIFLSSAYKAMAVNFTGPNSKINKEAMEFTKLMLKAYEALSKYKEESGEQDTDLFKVLVKRANAVTDNKVDGEIV